uniref:Uncharacterized protein n=1 Tax=Arundo donax TaxID=35708 RepID=A0A0A9A404_ARUDO
MIKGHCSHSQKGTILTDYLSHNFSVKIKNYRASLIVCRFYQEKHYHYSKVASLTQDKNRMAESRFWERGKNKF